MCGIFGYIGGNKAISEAISGIEKLEYRGYDSAGIAYINKDKKLKIKRKAGRVSILKDSLDLNEESILAISHTRWATHGKATERNSHPHKSGDFVIVHNGIIENYQELKSQLIIKNEKKNQGKIHKKLKFNSETDTEIIAKYLDYYFQKDFDKKMTKNEINNIILKSIKKSSEKFVGSWAVALINKKMPEKIYAFKHGSPLTVASADCCSYISSDANAIGKNELINKNINKKNNIKYYFLNDGDIVELSDKEIKFYDKDLKNIELKETRINKKFFEQDLCFEHYMLKEICEIPKVLMNTKKEFESKLKLKFFNEFLNFENITIIGCGTAYHAGLYGKYIFEKLLNKRINVELSSEFRYKTPIYSKNDLVLAISQSGETADTIAGLKIAKSYGATTAVITNVDVSTVTTICDYVLLTQAGAEIAVAATKSYVAQLLTLYMIALEIVKQNKIYNTDNYIENLMIGADSLIKKYMVKDIFEKYFSKKRFFFIGRSCDCSTASEGSLKLKEIAYMHSEGYPAGELKHGTLSLVDDETLVIAIITQEMIKEKTLNAVHEVKARGAKTLIVSQFEDLKDEADIILLPNVEESLMPLLSVIPLQMLSYHFSVSKGLNPDKPRNLAKSVTVE